jgi:hypothetical protein
MKPRALAGLTAPALVNNCDIRKTVNAGHGERWMPVYASAQARPLRPAVSYSPADRGPNRTQWTQPSAAVAKTHRLLGLKLDKGGRRGDRPGSERPGAA